MKTRILIIVGISITVFLLTAVVYPTINYRTWGTNEMSYIPPMEGQTVVCDEWLWQPPQNCRSVDTITDTNEDSKIDKSDHDVNYNPDSIDGFAIDDSSGNVKHYPINELHKMPCEEYQKIWNPEFVNVKESDILIDKLLDCSPNSSLQKVLDSCNNDSHKERTENILRYTNETHALLNLECEWKRIGYFVVD
ncbi:hypothetical protein [Nitrosopumilus sp.]|uniref:hypothetical protein n=1 Tax=Nitrosopumilus sp. TaxID=2024843 RepID=UPI00247DA29F|nr:hypothetical protein [Nitrosopumilus sp.]MCV0410146.1 hypothetical protein [Nitrosopumilus sp.]